jgi:GT2 family glycosyltransferase
VTRPPVVAVCLACHNRRDLTMRCLDSLYRQEGRGTAWRLTVHLVDDGSSDGTAEAVAASYPDVTIMLGTGKLYWGGGMAAAMDSARSERNDFILLLNDDVELEPGAIQLALHEHATAQSFGHPSIVVGAMFYGDRRNIVYSGYRRHNRLNPSRLVRIPPDPSELVECDTMNGNFVLIERNIFEQLGSIDRAYTHQLGDIDYGYRAAAAGVRIVIARQPLGRCKPGDKGVTLFGPWGTFLKRWQRFNSPLGFPLKPWASFMWRHGGLIGLLGLGPIYLRRVLKR